MDVGGETYTVIAPVTRAGEGRDTFYFVTITGEMADRIRFDALGLGSKRKSVKIIASVAGIDWQTSLFASGENWLLPLKLDVRRGANVTEGDRPMINFRIGG